MGHHSLVEPSTSHSINNVQDAVIGDDQSIPQVGSYQPTPEGSKFWIPDAKNKPVKGTIFDTLELALNFYKDYAREAGFEVVNKVINRRKRTSQRCRCDAKLRIRRTNENKWRVYMFLEKHNHRSNTSFQCNERDVWGFENIGVTDVECRNHKRGLNNFIGKRDAQMVVEKLLSRQEFFDNFLVKFKQDKVSKHLVGLFWADEKAKQYFDVFGDVVSFDATFRSNRYNMILVPFTGIDNHNWCILLELHN
ncbi:FAR1 DNA binding domain, zinc finger, SWIM-type, MULE transposase domain containing protein [Tanacetum coccineum]